MRIFLALTLVFTFFITAIVPVPAEAKRKVYRHTQSAPQYNPKYAAFLVDGDTGKILYQEDADKLRHPASLTKMMTLYLLFEALENRRLRMDTVLTASEYASTRPKTNLSMQVGDKITVGEAMLAIIVKSANDAAVIVAEKIGGSEDDFAKIMNQRAKQLGMKNTHFENANGLHDPRQITTAKDMALLGIALKKHFPQYFKFFSYRDFTYNGVNYTGHNHVMENYPGANGLKTGFVNASGFNLVTTATRRGINLVGVVLGGRTHQSRDAQMIKLLDYGFQKAATLKSQTYIAADYQTKEQDGKGDDEDETSEGDTADEAAPIATPVATAPLTAKPAAAIDQNESKNIGLSATKVETYENNTYVRTLAAPQQNKKQRYKSDMMVQPLSNPSTPLFVPAPKAKPKK